MQEAEPEPGALSAYEAALVAEACSRSAMLWVAGSDDAGPPWARPRPLWHVWHQDGVVLVVGGGEQTLPGLEDGLPGQLVVLVRSKDTSARVVEFLAAAHTLDPRRPEWESAAQALAAARLNAEDQAGQLERWRAGASVLRLDPLRVLAAGWGTEEEGAGAAPPAPSPATTVSGRPWHLGGRSGRAARLRRLAGGARRRTGRPGGPAAGPPG